jgi:hypothetical protein
MRTSRGLRTVLTAVSALGLLAGGCSRRRRWGRRRPRPNAHRRGDVHRWFATMLADRLGDTLRAFDALLD